MRRLGPPGRPVLARLPPQGPPAALVAALLLLVLAPPALAGWLLGAALLRAGLVSRWRLAAAATVTGALAALAIGSVPGPERRSERRCRAPGCPARHLDPGGRPRGPQWRRASAGGPWPP